VNSDGILIDTRADQLTWRRRGLPVFLESFSVSSSYLESQILPWIAS
jgi:hypothetical protein